MDEVKVTGGDTELGQGQRSELGQGHRYSGGGLTARRRR